MPEPNQDAFLKLLQAHEGIVRKVLYLYTDTQVDREDLYQEIVYQAWKSFGRFRGNARFSTWLYQVSLNTAMVYRRHLDRAKNFREVQEYDRLAPGPSDQQQQLLWAIRQLAKADRSLILLHLEGYGNGEIAGMLGLSANHVGVKLHRIRQRIGEIIKQEESRWT